VEEKWAGINDRESTCPCGGAQKRLISFRIGLHTDYASRDFVTEDITGEPIRITSRRQERELCKQHGIDRKDGKPKKDTYDFRVNNKLTERWI
jgi:hypothetical protein